MNEIKVFPIGKIENENGEFKVTVDSTDVLFYFAQKKAADMLELEDGDNIVITGGMINGFFTTPLYQLEHIYAFLIG